MRIARLAIMFLLAAGLAGAAGDQSFTDLQQVNKLLQAEYDLVKTGNPYLLVELQQHLVYMKASGLVLQSWRIDTVHSWGRPAVGSVTSLLQKTSFAEPERNVQIVDGQPVATKPFNALELSDMPTSYHLYLENGTEISVSSTPGGWLPRLGEVIGIAGWYLSRPLISNWNYLFGKSYNELALSLPEQEARMLYWAFNEGMPCLIGLPTAAPVKTP